MFIFKFSFLPCFAHSVLIVSKIIVSMILFILFCSFLYQKASVRQLESEKKFEIYFDDLLILFISTPASQRSIFFERN